MAELISDDDVVRLTAAAALTCGQMVLAPDGRVGIVTNIKPVATGDVASVKIRGIVKILSAATLSAGVTAAVHIANQTCIATGGAGTDAGELLYDVTSGGYAYIDLNP